MNLGARGAITSGGIPYVTDGLIGLWDAEWNVGYGLHDSTSEKLVNLCGTGEDFTMTNPVWGDDFIDFKTNSSTYGRISSDKAGVFPNTGDCTLELVFDNGGSYWAAYGVLLKTYDSCKIGIGNFYTGGLCVSNVASESTYALPSIDKISASVLYSSNVSKGVYIGNSSSAKTTDNSIGQSQSTVTIGRREVGNQWSGKFYTMRLYDKALSDDERTANWLIDKARFGLS